VLREFVLVLPGGSSRWKIHDDTVQLEFFPHPEVEPALSSLMCAVRVDDLSAFYVAC
jgi:hypothetical protein